MAVTARGGKDQVAGVIFHSDRGSTYTAYNFTSLCDALDIVQSMGRTGSCFDNAAAESFFSTLEHEVLSRNHFKTRQEAQRVIVKWVVDFYNCRRRHSSCGMQSPIDYETRAADRAA
jgi:putative transposase